MEYNIDQNILFLKKVIVGLLFALVSFVFFNIPFLEGTRFLPNLSKAFAKSNSEVGQSK